MVDHVSVTVPRLRSKLTPAELWHVCVLAARLLEALGVVHALDIRVVADVRPAAARHVRARPRVRRAQGSAQRIAWALAAELRCRTPAADDVAIFPPFGKGLHAHLQVALVGPAGGTIVRESPAIAFSRFGTLFRALPPIV